MHEHLILFANENIAKMHKVCMVIQLMKENDDNLGLVAALETHDINPIIACTVTNIVCFFITLMIVSICD